MKNYLHKILFIIASLTLLLLFNFPLWKISLGIPQYPKEIAVHIWINKMVNGTHKAMEIINVLNHNIGMKNVEPDSIQELKYFPWIIIVMVIAGLGVGVSGNKKAKIIWVLTLILLCILGLVDFYLSLLHKH